MIERGLFERGAKGGRIKGNTSKSESVLQFESVN